MDSYEVIITPHALSQLNDYISYIQYTLFTDQAAENVWQDALDTSAQLELSAGSLRFCKHPKLKELGYRPIFFLRHDYVILYRVENQIAFVDAIYHQLQDYENLFACELSD